MNLFSEFETTFSVKEAAAWASEFLGKNVTTSNITYLLNYGKIARLENNLIDKFELQTYYANIKNSALSTHPLSFSEFKEAETTKHIHRLHPYKGKFIPQLVEYFLDTHTDELKKSSCFKKGDVVLDFFSGSGTTLAVANELGLDGVGVDISAFNAILANSKIAKFDLNRLKNELVRLNLVLEQKEGKILAFENELNLALSEFNAQNFPQSFKRQVVLKEIDEAKFGTEKEAEFLGIFENIAKKHGVNLEISQNGTFLERWFFKCVREEILLLKSEIEHSPKELQNILKIILSRTARSTRATTHADLATLVSPVTKSYYCSKHGRICKPLFSILKWFKSYGTDCVKRFSEFANFRSATTQICLNADSRSVNIVDEVAKFNPKFAEKIKHEKIAGVFSSPPYVGLIDYHEQHAYAYEIFDLQRNDEAEIGSLKNGATKVAKEAYVKGISEVLLNAKRFLKEDYDVFLVANDKFDLYPKIATLAKMEIVERFERPVLNRSEKNKNRYSETIFHLKEAR